MLLHDLVVLTYLVGNDFLPAIPSLDIYNPIGLDVVMTIYRALQETGKLSGPITGSGCSHQRATPAAPLATPII